MCRSGQCTTGVSNTVACAILSVTVDWLYDVSVRHRGHIGVVWVKLDMLPSPNSPNTLIANTTLTIKALNLISRLRANPMCLIAGSNYRGGHI